MDKETEAKRKREAYWANHDKERKRKRKAQRIYDANNLEARRLRVRRSRSSAVPTRPQPLECECCGNEARRICMDHCHTTGLFRAWLCDHCNTALGMAKDDPAILRKLATILEDFTSRSNAGAETLEVSSGLAQKLAEDGNIDCTANVASNTNSSSEVSAL